MAGFPKASVGKGRLGEKAKRPHPGIPLDKETIKKLIIETGGNLARVADAMGTTRGTVRRRCQQDPELKEILDDARERVLDDLEEAVFDRALRSHDTTLQLFLLKTQGRHRGYEQSDTKEAAQDIAKAAFDYIINQQSK